MSAYIIFIRESTIDISELQRYAELVPGTLAGHEMKVLAAYGAQQVLEGLPNEGSVIVEFSSMEAARAWYDSAAYGEARVHRFNGAVYRAILVQGV